MRIEAGIHRLSATKGDHTSKVQAGAGPTPQLNSRSLELARMAKSKTIKASAPTPPQSESLEAPTFGMAQDIAWLTSHVQSVQSMLPMFVVIASAHTHAQSKKFETYLKRHSTNSRELHDGAVEFEVPAALTAGADSLGRGVDEARLFRSMLPNMALVYLVTVFDTFLARLLRSLFATKPEILNSSNRQLTYEQLCSFSSLQHARESVIEAEIDSIMRDSHTAHVDWIAKRTGIDLRKCGNLWMQFIELTERRNLFVHADGIVNDQYLAICRRNGVALAAEVRAGVRLANSRDYFDEACDCVIEIGTRLAQLLWRKLSPDTISEADQHLNAQCFHMLSARRYKTAEKLLRFAAGDLQSVSSEEHRLMFVCNLANSVLRQGRKDECGKLLAAEDWSALADKFKLAEAVLSEDYARAAMVMRRMGSDGEVTAADYTQWPIFEGFRTSTEFSTTFETLFGRAPESQQVTVAPAPSVPKAEAADLTPESQTARKRKHRRG